MSTINETTGRLRGAIEWAQRDLAGMQSSLERALKDIPADPLNAPVQAAMVMLGRFGFCVAHRDHFDAAIACVLIAASQDHETSEEGERLEKLLAYLESQRQFAD